MTESEAKIMLALVNVALEQQADYENASLRALASAIAEELTEAEPVTSGTCVACPPDAAHQQALDDQLRLNWLDNENACWNIRHQDSDEVYISADGPIRQVIDSCMKIDGEE